MNKYAMMFIIFLASFSALAQDSILHLSVENNSAKLIVVSKSDGSTFSLRPGETMNNVSFQRYSDAQSHIGGKVVCTWPHLDDITDTCMVIAGLIYEGLGKPYCRVWYHQTIPC